MFQDASPFLKPQGRLSRTADAVRDMAVVNVEKTGPYSVQLMLEHTQKQKTFCIDIESRVAAKNSGWKYDISAISNDYDVSLARLNWERGYLSICSKPDGDYITALTLHCEVCLDMTHAFTFMYITNTKHVQTGCPRVPFFGSVVAV